MNLHPGALAALRRLSADELDIAQMLAAGDLVSPQRYRNMWLFCMRVSGTGVSYRPQLDEFVYRQGDDYLTDRFLQRIGGLPVVMYHPPKQVLDSKEFAARIVGTVMLPYLQGDEVWAVCRIYDDETAKLLQSEQMSTSPGVVIGSDSVKAVLGDGSKLLVEGSPALVDHLAICERGVWDKGGEPGGVQAETRGDSVMAEEGKVEKKEERADEQFDNMLKGVCDRLDALCSRMDAMEEEDKKREDAARKDAEEGEKEKPAFLKEDRKDAEEPEPEEGKAKRLVADKARRDSEEPEEREREDKARKDARTDSLASLERTVREQGEVIRALTAAAPRPVSDEDYSRLVLFQARADEALVPLGKRAPRPLNGETPMAYRRRCAELLRGSSPKWKDLPINGLSDELFERVAEDQIYADAAVAARTPDGDSGSYIRAVPRRSESGHSVTEFVGNTHFVRQFSRAPVRSRVSDIRTTQRNA